MMEEIATDIRNGLDGKSFDGSLKFDCGSEGVIVLDNGNVTTQEQATDCTLRLSIENLKKLLRGQLNPMTAVMMGKIKISGDMAVAMKLGKLIG
ncbi:SCP2 sterol-binding domain-containing protein [Epibacterium sp. MM17-32]|uniref:SCP2 sterol-binding domain-containing protein n=1 Tax=Epibacterium sp. MM17-32 TaxID=2917734 RepID=UPI001EF4849B|nr:SCP2 sterol-binding domain-containing protein [Epibacterium sp. MM17-32]MCG7628303.1 SCP2 sterol-binding domain-containing protein [Epibacterium sp. MM17-32]